MPIIVKEEPTVHVTQSELDRYRQEYERDYMNYSGTPPALAEYIARKKAATDRIKKNYQGILNELDT